MGKKMICTISHRQTFPGGGFKEYTAGQVYDVSDIVDLAHFKPEAAPAFPAKTEEVKDNG